MSWPWSQLGLSGPSSLPEIRRAYAEKVKTAHPEEDPEGFQRLHAAYQLASRMARQKQREECRTSGDDERKPRPQECGAPPHPIPEEERNWEFDRLLEEDETPSRPVPEEEQNWDFDRLLEEDETPPRPVPEEEKDWDYDRLFAEGEAERAEERRRRGEERRKAQEKRSLRTEREEDRWRGTEAILHTIEQLHQAHAEQEAWEKFFQSPQFQWAMRGVDLVFGLEDFISARNPSQAMRIALFGACGFEKGVSRPELRPLYQMLLPAWKAKKRKQRKNLFYTLLGVPITIAVMLAACVILASSWFLGFVALGIGAVFGLKKGWLKRIPERVKKRTFNGSALCFLAGCVIVGAAVLPGILNSFQKAAAAANPREQVCRYLEEDFGENFRSVYNKNAPDERYSNVFAQEDNPAKQFMAGPDGVRNVKNGQYGYTTNYPEMRMLWALQDFAADHGITGIDNADRSQGLERWKTSGTFLITLPFYGAEETIEALGGLLESLSQESWYQVRTPDCELVLCGQPLREGRLVISRYKTADGAFDTESVRTQYTSSFAHIYCAQLLQDLELDRDFRNGGEPLSPLTNEGMAELKGETCCKLYGLDSEGETALEYYVSVSGTTIYCVPGGFWASGGTEEQITFAQVLHRKDANGVPTGIVLLFEPWLMPVT